MTAHRVRHAEVRWMGDDGELVYARRGDLVDVPDAEVPRLLALGALVDPDDDLSAETDDRPWADVLQEAADKRYDTAPT